MALTPRQLCANIEQNCSKDSAYYQKHVLSFLCNLANGAGYEFAVFCDPTTGAPVIVRYLFAASGNLSSEADAISAFFVDGTEYTGSIPDLVACAGEGGGGGDGTLLEAEFTEFTEVTAASIGAGFQNILVNSENLVSVLVVNLTNETIELSFDGTNAHARLASNEGRKYDFAQNRRFLAENIMARHTGTAPTDGTVTIEAYA